MQSREASQAEQEQEEEEEGVSSSEESPELDYKDEPPVYIPEDIPIPEGFELQESSVYNGLGVWNSFPIEKGEKFGPFGGALKDTVESPTSAWEVGSFHCLIRGHIKIAHSGISARPELVTPCLQINSNKNVWKYQVLFQIFSDRWQIVDACAVTICE